MDSRWASRFCGWAGRWVAEGKWQGPDRLGQAMADVHTCVRTGDRSIGRANNGRFFQRTLEGANVLLTLTIDYCGAARLTDLCTDHGTNSYLKRVAVFCRKSRASERRLKRQQSDHGSKRRLSDKYAPKLFQSMGPDKKESVRGTKGQQDLYTCLCTCLYACVSLQIG